MNTSSNKLAVFLTTGIMAFVASMTFLIVPISVTFIIAYLFTMLAITMFCFGKIYMLINAKSYPWFAAFPIAIWQYLIAQLSLSAVFVLRGIIFASFFSIRLFIFLHILLLSLFLVRLLLIKGGKDLIEQKDNETKQKVAALRFMQADIESLMRRLPEYEQDLKRVAEALRYSDPISHSSLAVYEEQIQRGIVAMQNGGESIPTQCEELLRQIADRNAKVKILK